MKQQLKDFYMKKDSARSKSPQSSRLNEDLYRNYQENKENSKMDLKDEMLKLPIFQNSNNNYIFEVSEK